MKKVLIFLIILMVAEVNYAQRILLEQNVHKDSVIPKYGQNRKHYISTVIGIGGIAGKAGSGAEILYGKSSEFTLGVIYKRRITNHYAAGFKLSYDLDNYRLKPDSIFSQTNTLKLDKEKEVFNSFSLGIYNRINFDKRRGNKLGHFLDIGAYCSWFFNVTYNTKDKINGNKIKTIISRLDYPEKTGYGIYAQLGFNRLLLYSKYRISDFFKESKNYPELPHFVIGAMIDISN